jgi:hypothetical protein
VRVLLIIAAGMLVVAFAAVVTQLPDIRRYLKIRSM